VTPPRSPFVVIGGTFHGEVVDATPQGGRSPVVLQRARPVFLRADEDPEASSELPRMEVFDLRRFAICDPYTDPREWADIVSLDPRAVEAQRRERRGMVHPERRSGWFLVSTSLGPDEALAALLGLFGETARTAYQDGTGVWEWLGVFGLRERWQYWDDRDPADPAGRYVEAAPLFVLYGVPFPDATGGASPFEPQGVTRQAMRNALETLRAITAVETRTRTDWRRSLPPAAAADIASAVAYMRRRLVAEAQRREVEAEGGERVRAQMREEAAMLRARSERAESLAAALAEPAATGVVDPEANLARADAAGQGWRARADAVLAGIDNVLGDGTEWTTPARWSPDLEEHADA
jgi:hypothetical protein